MWEARSKDVIVTDKQNKYDMNLIFLYYCGNWQKVHQSALENLLCHFKNKSLPPKQQLNIRHCFQAAKRKSPKEMSYVGSGMHPNVVYQFSNKVLILVRGVILQFRTIHYVSGLEPSPLQAPLGTEKFGAPWAYHGPKV